MHRSRRSVAAITAAVVCGLSLAAPAMAGQDLLTPTGVITGGGIIGPRHSITNVHGVTWTGGYLACVTALNDDGSQAGTSDCEVAGTLANHDYNGTLRRGMVYPYPRDNVSGSAYQQWG